MFTVQKVEVPFKRSRYATSPHRISNRRDKIGGDYQEKLPNLTRPLAMKMSVLIALKLQTNLDTLKFILG